MSSTAALPKDSPAAPSPLLEQHVITKISRRLLWFLFVLFVASFLDRINIGFAGLTMMGDLRLTSTQFGLATTMFYVAYIACGIPSNMILARIGARKWIGTIMIAWGLASTATMFATGPGTLYLLRILVGITEAGFLPGMLLFLTFWFPSAYRARANALFMIALIVKSFSAGASNTTIGWLAAIPQVVTIVSMIWWGRHSDRRQERKWHLVWPMIASAIGWLFTAYSATPVLQMLGICMASAGAYTAMSIFWTTPDHALSFAARAIGIAVINATGNIGSALNPVVVGWLRDATHSFASGLLFASVLLVVGALVVFLLPIPSVPKRAS